MVIAILIVLLLQTRRRYVFTDLPACRNNKTIYRQRMLIGLQIKTTTHVQGTVNPVWDSITEFFVKDITKVCVIIEHIVWIS